jgi:hypothetical protein
MDLLVAKDSQKKRGRLLIGAIYLLRRQMNLSVQVVKAYFALLLSLTLLVSKVYGESENCDLSRFEYKGYQVNSQEQWAILGIRGRDDEVFFKGENIFGVASLLEINSKYLTLKCSQSGKLYKLGRDGISALKTSSFLESLSNNPQLTHLIFKKKSNNVIKVEAEHPSLYWSIPSTIIVSNVVLASNNK